MRRSELLSGIIDALKASTARYRRLNDGSHVNKSVGWLILVLGVLYASAATILSFVEEVNVITFFVIVAFSIIVWWLFSFVRGIRVNLNIERNGELASPVEIFFWIFLPFLLLAIFGWFASYDTGYQWRQLNGNMRYNDVVHPILHTGLLWLFSRFHGSVSGVVVVQVGIFAGLMTWMCLSLAKLGINKKLITALVALSSASPLGLTVLLVPWKDTIFSLSVLCVIICLIDILVIREVKFRYVSACTMGVALFLASFLRHNGFFYTVPLVLMLPFCVSRSNVNRVLFSIAIALVLSISYLIVRESCLDLDWSGRKDRRFTESVGLPMSIILESYVTNPAKVPQDVRDFIRTIGEDKLIRRKFTGDYNSVKFTIPNVSVKVAAVGEERFSDMFIRTILANPESAVKAFLYVTSQAWAVFPRTLHRCVSHDKETGAWRPLICKFQTSILKSPIGALWAAPGWFLTCIILSLCYGILRKGWRVCVLAVPIICYQFGTMLFLAGMDYRFFYVTVLTGGVICVMLLVDSPAHKEQEESLCE